MSLPAHAPEGRDLYQEDRLGGVDALLLMGGERLAFRVSPEQLAHLGAAWRRAKYYESSGGGMSRNVRSLRAAEYPVVDFNLRDVVLVQRKD